jgi:hypothetical protein
MRAAENLAMLSRAEAIDSLLQRCGAEMEAVLAGDGRMAGVCVARGARVVDDSAVAHGHGADAAPTRNHRRRLGSRFTWAAPALASFVVLALAGCGGEAPSSAVVGSSVSSAAQAASAAGRALGAASGAAVAQADPAAVVPASVAQMLEPLQLGAIRATRLEPADQLSNDAQAGLGNTASPGATGPAATTNAPPASGSSTVAMVERNYWVEFTGGSASQAGVVATLFAAGPQTTVIAGTLDVGDVPAATRVTPVGTITLRHPRAAVPSLASLQWRFAARKAGTVNPQAGRLLEGPPGISMVQAVRDYSVPEVPQPPEDVRRLRFLLMTKSGVTVGQLNAALVSIGAQIVEMRFDDPTLSIEVPGSDRVDVPGRVLEKLEATQLFELITPLN